MVNVEREREREREEGREAKERIRTIRRSVEKQGMHRNGTRRKYTSAFYEGDARKVSNIFAVKILSHQ